MNSVYRHFKGGSYVKLHEALDSETQAPLVVYISLEHGTIWARPAAMWAEVTDRWPDRVPRPRFVLEDELPKDVLNSFAECRPFSSA